ncbi:MAG: PAS domain S-box protein [Candidatus Krumholzibacteriia bacterium]
MGCGPGCRGCIQTIGNASAWRWTRPSTTTSRWTRSSGSYGPTARSAGCTRAPCTSRATPRAARSPSAWRPTSPGAAAPRTRCAAPAARYRALYDAAHVGITITDLAGTLLYANAAAAELYGAESVAALLAHARRHDGIRSVFLEPAERDRFVQAMQEDERGRASRTIAVRRLDGYEVSMRVSCGLMTNPESGRQEILAILEDVTERLRAEAELRRSEERYRRLVEFLPDAVLVHDGRQVVLANPACVRLFGARGPGLVGCELTVLAGAPALLSPEAPAGGEVWLQRRDGSPFPAQVTSLPMAAGRVLSVVKDLTHLRRAGEEIAAQQAILEALIETMPLGIVAKDLGQDLRYVVWNRYMEEELGLGKDVVLGRRDVEIFPRAFALAMQDQDRLAASRGEPVDLGEISLPWADEHLVLRAVKVPVRDADGRVARVFTIVENITRQRQLQATLQQSRRMEAVGRLAAAVAHDFNNVLQVVQGYTEVMQRGRDRQPPFGDEVELVLAAVTRARQLIQRLLNYSRYDTVNPELVDLNQLGERLVASSRTLLPEAMRVAFQPAPDLPRVYADPQQIEEALLNLVANARDALPGEGVIQLRTAVVELGHEFCSTRPWARPGRYVQVTVHDDGCGIPPDARDHIYEPFYTTKGFGQGTGLGLAIAYTICKRHHGYLDFESELDVGTTFHLLLPLPAVASEVGRREEPCLPEPSGRGELLLVVDDDEMVRNLTRQMLERAGYQVLSARDGEDAMELFMAHATEVAALVIDVVMPRMDGRQLYDNISELRPGVPVLFCSSYSADLLESEYMLRVGGTLLAKPFRVAELLLRVRQVLDQGQAAGR